MSDRQAKYNEMSAKESEEKRLFNELRRNQVLNNQFILNLKIKLFRPSSSPNKK